MEAKKPSHLAIKVLSVVRSYGETVALREYIFVVVHNLFADRRSMPEAKLLETLIRLINEMTEYFIEPALLVGEIDEDINFSLPPVSGEEYIKRVVIEAQQCADVVVADINRKQLKRPTIDIEPLSGCVEAPPWLGPTRDWQSYQISEFSDTRLYVSQLKNDVETCKRKLRRCETNLPDIDDEKGWINFCSGYYEEKAKTVPSLSLVFHLNQPMIEQILEYLVQHLSSLKTIQYELGQWIYALLVVLEMPLTPDEKLDVHEVGALNLFICLVSRYFRQLDLADP